MADWKNMDLLFFMVRPPSKYQGPSIYGSWEIDQHYMFWYRLEKMKNNCVNSEYNLTQLSSEMSAHHIIIYWYYTKNLGPRSNGSKVRKMPNLT